MRARSFLIAGSVLTATACAVGLWLGVRSPVESPPPTEIPTLSAVDLERLAGQNLRLLPEEEQIHLLVAVGAPADELERAWGAKPWHLWRRAVGDGPPGYILFCGRPLVTVPGNSGAAVYFLDLNGRVLGNTEFLTGYRINIVDAAYIPDPGLGAAVIEVRTEPVINGEDICRQVYGVFGDRVGLLRVEDEDHRLVASFWCDLASMIGPPAPNFSADEWERALQDGAPARALEALTWIGGRHRLDTPPPYSRPEDADAFRRVAEVRRHEGVRVAIRRLAGADHRWVREAAAAAALELEDGRDGE